MKAQLIAIAKRVWASEKWRSVALVFVVCKVVAPLLVFLTMVTLWNAHLNVNVPSPSTFSPFIMWLKWDGFHYVDLVQRFNYFQSLTPGEHSLIAQAAAGGHFNVPSSLHRFTWAPLYPVLGKLMSFVTFGHPLVALLLVANIGFIACLALVYDLTRLVMPQAAARDSVVLLALAPTGFVLQSALSESVFLALALGCFVLAEQRRWGWVVPLAAALALTRSFGFLIAPALLLVLLGQHGWRFRRDDVVAYAKALPALAAAPLAWGAFMAYCKIMTGDWLAYNHLQAAGWYATLHEPLQWVAALFRYRGLVSVKAWFVLAAIVLLALAVRRLSPGYWFFGFMLLILPLATGSWDQSIMRYLVVLFPIVLVGVDFVGRHPRWRLVLFSVLGATEAVLLVVWQLLVPRLVV